MGTGGGYPATGAPVLMGGGPPTICEGGVRAGPWFVSGLVRPTGGGGPGG